LKLPQGKRRCSIAEWSLPPALLMNPPMVSDGYKFILPLLLLATAAYFVQPVAAILPLGLAAFVAYFFRNPERAIPDSKNIIVSPADGKVVKVVPLPQTEGQAGGHGISVFLNIFDVHVNRAPIQGIVESLEYKRGRFKVAYDEEASRVNEQNIIRMRGQGIELTIKQVAGLIARRVICWKKPGQNLERGELFGLIRFGSRVDILLPEKVKVLVNVGDRVKGGSSVLGEYDEPA
jgi:phosphatidylserine decarboxylase